MAPKLARVRAQPLTQARKVADDIVVWTVADTPQAAASVVVPFRDLRAELEGDGLALHDTKTVAIATGPDAAAAYRAMAVLPRDPPLVPATRDLGLNASQEGRRSAGPQGRRRRPRGQDPRLAWCARLQAHGGLHGHSGWFALRQ